MTPSTIKHLLIIIIIDNIVKIENIIKAEHNVQFITYHKLNYRLRYLLKNSTRHFPIYCTPTKEV